jgi:hypothetical protein
MDKFLLVSSEIKNFKRLFNRFLFINFFIILSIIISTYLPSSLSETNTENNFFEIEDLEISSSPFSIGNNDIRFYRPSLCSEVYDEMNFSDPSLEICFFFFGWS